MTTNRIHVTVSRNGDRRYPPPDPSQAWVICCSGCCECRTFATWAGAFAAADHHANTHRAHILVVRDDTPRCRIAMTGYPWIAICRHCAHAVSFTGWTYAYQWATQHANQHTTEPVGGTR